VQRKEHINPRKEEESVEMSTRISSTSQHTEPKPLGGVPDSQKGIGKAGAKGTGGSEKGKT